MSYKRKGGRAHDEMRPVVITPNYTRYAEGSVLIEVGETRVVLEHVGHLGTVG